jgi:hypothetical protein
LLQFVDQAKKFMGTDEGKKLQANVGAYMMLMMSRSTY